MSRTERLGNHFAALLTCCSLLATAESSVARAADELTLDAVVLRPFIEAEVPARRTGAVAMIAVEEGAVVEAGEPLAFLDDRTARLALDKAELERRQVHAKATNQLRIEYADKALEVARAELERSSESNSKFAKSVSQSQLDVERLTIEKLELERRQAEHDLQIDRFELQLKENAVETAKLDLDLHAVRAPFAGVVSLVRGRVGEWVEPGAPVARLVAVDKLRAEGFAPAGVADQRLIGRRVVFLPAIDGDVPSTDERSAEGTLRFVSPEIDPVAGQVRVWAEIDNQNRRWRPGEQGRLIIRSADDKPSASANE